MDTQSRATVSLITGVAGFVGSHLAEALLAMGHTVVGTDCLTDYYSPAIKKHNLQGPQSNPRFRFLQADLLKTDLRSLLSAGKDQANGGACVDYVFHLAAQPGVRASWGKSFEIYTRNNIEATQALLEAAKQLPIKKFVYASSSSVYGDAETYPTAETLAPHPISPYGVSKLAAEHLCMLYWRNYGVRTVGLRYFTVYGPRQRPDMGFNKFISAMLDDKEIEIYGDGEQTRDFTYVSDAVQGTISGATSEAVGEVFNIGGGSRVTVNQVLRTLESIVGKKAKVKYIENQKGDVRHTAADISKAQRLLGYRPQVTTKEGLAREVEWMQGALAASLGR